VPPRQRSHLRRVGGCATTQLVLSPWANTETTTAELNFLITVDGIFHVSLPELQEEPEAKLHVVTLGWSLGHVNGLHWADLSAKTTALTSPEQTPAERYSYRPFSPPQENGPLRITVKLTCALRSQHRARCTKHVTPISNSRHVRRCQVQRLVGPCCLHMTWLWSKTLLIAVN